MLVFPSSTMNFGILVARERSSFRREITLTRMDPVERTSADENDDMTINDGFSDSGHVMTISSLSSYLSYGALPESRHKKGAILTKWWKTGNYQFGCHLFRVSGVLP